MDDEPKEFRSHLITWQRAAKGDLAIGHDGVGYMNSAQVIDRSILAYLCTIGKANDAHVAASKTYLDWQLAYTSLAGCNISRYFECSGGEGELENRIAKYLILIRKLDRLAQQQIDLALSNDAMRIIKRKAVFDERDAWLCRFDTLIRFVREAEREFKERMEKKSACAKPQTVPR